MADLLLSKQALEELAHHQQLWVGFSGGLDSTVLLHHLALEPSLSGKMQAVHVHHGLQARADDWQRHCQKFCRENQIPLVVQRIQLNASSNIEEQARAARYHVFASLVKHNEALVLGHHADDQAETLLLQLCRGSGVDGLSAMSDYKVWEKGALLRPLLSFSRQQLKAYAEHYQLTWVEDESNQDIAFSRNYLRHQIMPLLREKWPGVVGNLSRSAAHCQQAKNNLERLAEMDCLATAGFDDTLSLVTLRALSEDRLVNALRAWLKHHRVRCPSTSVLDRLIVDVIGSHQDAQPMIAWDGHEVRRYQHNLYLLKQVDSPIAQPSDREWFDFPKPLILGGKANVALQAVLSNKGVRVPTGCRVSVRYRQGGELFRWHGQTKQLKKLWQQWSVPPWHRDQVPLIYLEDDLAVIVGYAMSDLHCGENHASLYQIEQKVMDSLKS